MKKIKNVRNHVSRNRTKYGFAAGFIAATAIHIKAAKQWNEFLDENDLTDQFYNEED